MSDLMPYVCTFEECNLYQHLFTSRDEWYKHEQLHLTEWCCNVHGHPPFRSSKSFTEHMSTVHSTRPTSSQLALFLEMFQRPISGSKPSGTCRLCNAEAKRLKSHMSRHLEDIALFALPRRYDLGDDVEDNLEVSGRPEEGNSLPSKTRLESKISLVFHALSLPSHMTNSQCRSKGLEISSLHPIITTFTNMHAREDIPIHALGSWKAKTLKSGKTLPILSCNWGAQNVSIFNI